MPRKARVLAIGRMAGRARAGRLVVCMTGAGGSGAGRDVMKVAQVAPPVARSAPENKKPRHRAGFYAVRRARGAPAVNAYSGVMFAACRPFGPFLTSN